MIDSCQNTVSSRKVHILLPLYLLNCRTRKTYSTRSAELSWTVIDNLTSSKDATDIEDSWVMSAGAHRTYKGDYLVLYVVEPLGVILWSI